MAEALTTYPVRLDIDYPDRNLNRLTTFFRLFTIIPIAIIIGLISSSSSNWTNQAGGCNWEYAAGGLVFLPLVLMLLFRQKYPRWWFDWNLALTRFCTRVSAYFMLLRDEYPSTDEEQAVHLDISYPDAKKLNRWLPLIKWFLAIPHCIILCFLGIAAIVSAIIAWFAILFTGRYPRGLFDFVVVEAYVFLLTTDRYPPFSTI